MDITGTLTDTWSRLSSWIETSGAQTPTSIPYELFDHFTDQGSTPAMAVLYTVLGLGASYAIPFAISLFVDRQKQENTSSLIEKICQAATPTFAFCASSLLSNRCGGSPTFATLLATVLTMADVLKSSHRSFLGSLGLSSIVGMLYGLHIPSSLSTLSVSALIGNASRYITRQVADYFASDLDVIDRLDKDSFPAMALQDDSRFWEMVEEYITDAMEQGPQSDEALNLLAYCILRMNQLIYYVDQSRQSEVMTKWTERLKILPIHIKVRLSNYIPYHPFGEWKLWDLFLKQLPAHERIAISICADPAKAACTLCAQIVNPGNACDVLVPALKSVFRVNPAKGDTFLGMLLRDALPIAEFVMMGLKDNRLIWFVQAIVRNCPEDRYPALEQLLSRLRPMDAHIFLDARQQKLPELPPAIPSQTIETFLFSKRKVSDLILNQRLLNLEVPTYTDLASSTSQPSSSHRVEYSTSTPSLAPTTSIDLEEEANRKEVIQNSMNELKQILKSLPTDPTFHARWGDLASTLFTQCTLTEYVDVLRHLIQDGSLQATSLMYLISHNLSHNLQPSVIAGIGDAISEDLWKNLYMLDSETSVTTRLIKVLAPFVCNTTCLQSVLQNALDFPEQALHLWAYVVVSSPFPLFERVKLIIDSSPDAIKCVGWIQQFTRFLQHFYGHQPLANEIWNYLLANHSFHDLILNDWKKIPDADNTSHSTQAHPLSDWASWQLKAIMAFGDIESYEWMLQTDKSYLFFVEGLRRQENSISFLEKYVTTHDQRKALIQPIFMGEYDAARIEVILNYLFNSSGDQAESLLQMSFMVIETLLTNPHSEDRLQPVLTALGRISNTFVQNEIREFLADDRSKPFYINTLYLAAFLSSEHREAAFDSFVRNPQLSALAELFHIDPEIGEQLVQRMLTQSIASGSFWIECLLSSNLSLAKAVIKHMSAMQFPLIANNLVKFYVRNEGNPHGFQRAIQMLEEVNYDKLDQINYLLLHMYGSDDSTDMRRRIFAALLSRYGVLNSDQTEFVRYLSEDKVLQLLFAAPLKRIDISSAYLLVTMLSLHNNPNSEALAKHALNKLDDAIPLEALPLVLMIESFYNSYIHTILQWPRDNLSEVIYSIAGKLTDEQFEDLLTKWGVSFWIQGIRNGFLKAEHQTKLDERACETLSENDLRTYSRCRIQYFRDLQLDYPPSFRAVQNRLEMLSASKASTSQRSAEKDPAVFEGLPASLRDREIGRIDLLKGNQWQERLQILTETLSRFGLHTESVEDTGLSTMSCYFILFQNVTNDMSKYAIRDSVRGLLADNNITSQESLIEYLKSW